jgi:hypothetical protein
MALSLVGTRTIEGAVIVAGVACLLTVVTLRQAGVGPDGLVTGQALVGLYDRLFLSSQSTMPAFNALMLAPLLYWSRLVPRVLPTVGLIAAPLLLTGTAAVLFRVVERGSLLQLLLGIPIALWAFSLGVYLVVKGFKPAPITAGMVAIQQTPSPMPKHRRRTWIPIESSPYGHHNPGPGPPATRPPAGNAQRTHRADRRRIDG